LTAFDVPTMTNEEKMTYSHGGSSTGYFENAKNGAASR
jgi:hypothetical protein